MNTSDWKKATAFITEQNGPAATAPTEELNSMPLRTLSLDESGLTEVTYGAHMPLATSTPNSIALNQQDPISTDTYQPILHGVPHGSLYLTLTAMSMEHIAPAPAVICTLCSRVHWSLFRKTPAHCKNNKTV